MLFRAETSVPIPTKDILSWSFDAPGFDQDRPLYINAKKPSKSISARQARTLIRKLVAGFHASGLKKGDCVCIHSFNDIYYPILVQGIIASGGIFTGSNPSYTQYELRHHLTTAQAKFVITEPAICQNIIEAAGEIGITASKIWIFDVFQKNIPLGYRTWRELLGHGEEDWVRFDDEELCRTTPAARLFSSGTTGLPKAADLSHQNLIAQHTLVHEIDKRPYQTSGLLCLPMFHAACVPIAHIIPLRSGHISYVLRRFELEPFLKAYQDYKITDMRIVPTIVIATIMSPITKNYSLRSVQWASCGAAPLGKEAQSKMRELLAPGAVFSQVWGMTETSCIATKFYHPESDDTGSVGRLLPNLDGKLIDDEGKDISAYDTRGELCVRGPTIISRYFGNEQANADSFDSEGYFKTGDIAYCDGATKKWYIVDRKKELIKVRGFQVAPPEIENVLLSHPNIVDAAVIGIKLPNNADVEHPRAYVVKRQDAESAKLEAEDVKKYCAERLAKYKELTGGVIFLDAIPKNASGKILKRTLRELVVAEFRGSQPKL